MMRESAVIPRIQSRVIAYVQGERTLYDTQFMLEADLQDLLDEVSRDVRKASGALSGREAFEEKAGRLRAVYAELLIEAEQSAVAGGVPLGLRKIEKLLHLLCWMRDTTEELGQPYPPPTASEAA